LALKLSVAVTPGPALAASGRIFFDVGHQIYTVRPTKCLRRDPLWSDLGFNAMTDNQYMAGQVGIICVLLFLVAVAAVSQHPQWFG
jgi:hypothetical protein